MTSVLPEDVRWESDWGTDRLTEREKGFRGRIDWLLPAVGGIEARAGEWRPAQLQHWGCEQHGKLLHHSKDEQRSHSGRKHLVTPRMLSWCHLHTSFSSLAFCFCSLLLQQHLSLQSGGHHQLLRPTPLQHLDTPQPLQTDSIQSSRKGIDIQRERMAGKLKELVQTQTHSSTLWGPGKKQALRPYFSPL